MRSIKLYIPIIFFLLNLPAMAQNASTTIPDKNDSGRKEHLPGKIDANVFSDFKPGYVILLNGDTVRGEIDYRSDAKMSKICRFVSKDKTSEISYSPEEIKAYRFENGKFFIARDIRTENNQTERLFLEYLINGKMNVYYYKDSNGNHYLIDKEGRELIELPYEEKIKRDSTGFNYLDKTTRHKGILLVYLQDEPSMANEISKLQEPSHESLIKLAKDYHKAVCGDYSCLVYEKKESLVNCQVELVAGVQLISNSIDYNFIANNYFTTGVIVKFGQPRIDENLFIKTGLLYARLEDAAYWTGSTYYSSKFRSYYKVPLQVEYMIQKGTFHPRIGYGVNVYYPIFTSVSFTPGLDIRLTKRVGLSLNTDIEFVPTLLIIPQSYMGMTFTAGIHYAF